MGGYTWNPGGDVRLDETVPAVLVASTTNV